jgi:hypothetical protein
MKMRIQLQQIFNWIVAGNEAFVLPGNKFLYPFVKKSASYELSPFLTPVINSLLLKHRNYNQFFR